MNPPSKTGYAFSIEDGYDLPFRYQYGCIPVELHRSLAVKSNLL
ncbi:MAG: hypothetical protein WDZ91_16245 [Paenibacillaceae bacterium]